MPRHGFFLLRVRGPGPRIERGRGAGGNHCRRWRQGRCGGGGGWTNRAPRAEMRSNHARGPKPSSGAKTSCVAGVGTFCLGPHDPRARVRGPVGLPGPGRGAWGRGAGRTEGIPGGRRARVSRGWGGGGCTVEVLGLTATQHRAPPNSPRAQVTPPSPPPGPPPPCRLAQLWCQGTLQNAGNQYRDKSGGQLTAAFSRGAGAGPCSDDCKGVGERAKADTPSLRPWNTRRAHGQRPTRAHTHTRTR